MGLQSAWFVSEGGSEVLDEDLGQVGLAKSSILLFILYNSQCLHFGGYKIIEALRAPHSTYIVVAHDPLPAKQSVHAASLASTVPNLHQKFHFSTLPNLGKFTGLSFWTRCPLASLTLKIEFLEQMAPCVSDAQKLSFLIIIVLNILEWPLKTCLFAT